MIPAASTVLICLVFIALAGDFPGFQAYGIPIPVRFRTFSKERIVILLWAIQDHYSLKTKEKQTKNIKDWMLIIEAFVLE